MGCHKITPQELRDFAARFCHQHPSFADVVRQAAEALAEAQGYESGEPPQGSRLWRCEKELAKARERVDILTKAIHDAGMVLTGRGDGSIYISLPPMKR